MPIGVPVCPTIVGPGDCGPLPSSMPHSVVAGRSRCTLRLNCFSTMIALCAVGRIGSGSTNGVSTAGHEVIEHVAPTPWNAPPIAVHVAAGADVHAADASCAQHAPGGCGQQFGAHFVLSPLYVPAVQLVPGDVTTVHEPSAAQHAPVGTGGGNVTDSRGRPVVSVLCRLANRTACLVAAPGAVTSQP